jgi:hypothetical protein
MQLHASMTIAVLYLFQHLKACFLVAKDCLATSYFMLTSKIMCDDTYLNKLWHIADQGVLLLWEISQMEQKMCSHLKWQLSINPLALHGFQACVQLCWSSPIFNGSPEQSCFKNR